MIKEFLPNVLLEVQEVTQRQKLINNWLQHNPILYSALSHLLNVF